MNATVKFYTGFVLVLALVVGAAFALGFRVGYLDAVTHGPVTHGRPR